MPVIVTFDFPPAYGGIQRYSARLAESLSELGHAVAVVAPAQRGAAAFDKAINARVLRFGGRGRALQMLAALAQTLRARRRVGDRVTIAMSWFPAGLTAALLPRTMRGNLTILAHGSELAARPRSLRSRLMPAVFNRADHVVANSRYTAQRLRDLGIRRPVAVVPCGVDVADIAPARSSVPTIVFVGRLVPRKGCDRLIRCVARIRNDVSNVRLEIVGDGPDKARLQQLATESGVTENVEFLGTVSDTERDAAYARAWCFAMPARDERGDVEGFGIVYLEAAMAGLPVVGGKGSGAEDAIVDGVTGFVVDGNDEAAIADAVIALLSDPVRANAMGAAGRSRARSQYTWRHNAVSMAREIGLAVA